MAEYYTNGGSASGPGWPPPKVDVKIDRLFQTGVNVSRTAAIRGVAGDVQKLTFLFAFRAGLRGQRGGQSIAAFTAFPKSLGWSRRGH